MESCSRVDVIENRTASQLHTMAVKSTRRRRVPKLKDREENMIIPTNCFHFENENGKMQQPQGEMSVNLMSDSAGTKDET